MSETPSNILPALKVVPTLIVGLGGTGSLALQYAKQKIRRQLLARARGGKLPHKIPFVEFLSLDTTAQEEFVEYLTGDEQLNMGHINVPQIINSIDRRPAFQRSLKWFPRHLNPGQIDAGARGVRHIGRLCFFDKKRLIDPRLRNKIRSITDYAAVDKELREHFIGVSVEPQSTVDVHIISSLCGGTGSACLLDVAYLVKHIIYELLKQSTNSAAHLVTTDPFMGDPSIGESSREYMRYNFAVALSEIERFMTFDVPLAEADGHDGLGHWQVEYLDGSIVSSVEKPFSLTYLLGYKEGETLSKGNVCELIGESVCLMTAHPAGALLKGRLDNVKAHVINQVDPSTRKIRAYSSYNAHILSAEFSEQTAEIAIVLAARAIIDSLCNDGHSAPKAGESGIKFGDLFSKLAARKDQSGGLSLGFSAAEVDQHVDQVEAALNFLSANFAKLTAKSGAEEEAKQSWLKRLTGNKGGSTLDALIRRGNLSFTEKKTKHLRECEKVEDDVRKWVAEVASNIGLAVKRFLRNGMSLGEVVKVLDLFLQEAEKIRVTLKKRRARLNYDGKPDPGWIGEAIKGKKFPDAAAARLRAEVMSRLIENVEDPFSAFTDRIADVKTQCHTAFECLRLAEARLQERLTRPDSFTESSIWSRNLLAEKLEYEHKMKLVQRFIERTDIVASEKSPDEPLAFLAYLNSSETNRALLVEGLLREVGSEVVREVFEQSLPLNNLESDVLSFDIGKMVDHAAPAWQVDRAGSDIAEVSLTNCPQNTKLGEIIADLGRSISFSQNSSDSKRMFIFRSEHGSTAERLLGFRACLDSVRRKLKMEKKSHINDICLDPDWKIEDPTVAQKVDFYSALFSLGELFRMINYTKRKSFFANGSKDFTLAESEDASKKVERSVSFANFIQHLAAGQPSVKQLAEKIHEQWDTLSDTETEKFRDDVLAHLGKLERRSEEERESGAGEEVERELDQYHKEIEALKTQVMPVLNLLLAGDGDRSQVRKLSGEEVD